MPRAPRRCNHDGCTNRQRGPYCKTHERPPFAGVPRAPDTRPSPARRGYDRDHRDQFRVAVLARDPVCVLCGVEPSVVADHWPRSRRDLVAEGLDPNDPDHGRGLCTRCHNTETAQTQRW